jgi:ABC-type nitrate/sulfonate/bicarbonate transport system permease component
VHLISGANAPWTVEHAPSTVSTDPANLPYYAARSLLRMFAALALSLVFTFVYATAAARLRRAEKVLIPLLDILQSVPILGFLSITITGFIALFPGSELGLECASIFAIFTSQAWNMAFAFYYSLISQPRELDEASRLLRLTRWQRFWRVDVPSGMIPLVWNGMMSFGGGWFFLTASEALNVNNHQFALPGIGAYVAAASDAGELSNVLLAAAHGVGGTISGRGIRKRGGTPQPHPRLAATLPHSPRGRAPARSACPPNGPGDGPVRGRRTSPAIVSCAPPRRRLAVRAHTGDGDRLRRLPRDPLHRRERRVR